uniref:Uncharacterized protein n=1 Tax=Tetranychus urticae TaxID=32264 RepID=T1KIE2_TETUR
MHYNFLESLVSCEQSRLIEGHRHQRPTIAAKFWHFWKIWNLFEHPNLSCDSLGLLYLVSFAID